MPKTEPAITISGTYEKNISTKQHQEEAHPRLSRADAHESGSRCSQRSPSQRQSSVNPLIVLSSRHSEKFGREHRLRKATEYKTILDKRSTSDKTIARRFVFFARDNTHDTARLGIAVGTRALKRAVHRNRIKRMVRESFRKNRYRLPARDYVVICRGGQPPRLPGCREALKSFWDTQAGGA